MARYPILSMTELLKPEFQRRVEFGSCINWLRHGEPNGWPLTRDRQTQWDAEWSFDRRSA